MAALGGVLTGKGGMTWFRSLRRPRFQIPLKAFFAVAAFVYVFYGIVLYRLIALDLSTRSRIVCLVAVGVAMLYSELWNYLFFGRRSTLAGLVGIVGFVPILLVVETSLFLLEPLSALILLPYAAYFVLYDIPWATRLWKLNPQPPTPRSGIVE